MSVVDHFRRVFSAQGSADRARAEKAYLKSPLRFHGVAVPVVRREARAYVKANPSRSADELRERADALFATDFHELRSAAIAILEREVKLLGAGELPWLIGLARLTAGWAHVDWLATGVIADVIVRTPTGPSHLRRWAEDEDLWVRRTALLSLLPVLRKGEGDFALFEELAAPMLDEKEFFIRKAIGWVLRDVSKRKPEWTVRFVRAHATEMAGLTFREATRLLEDTKRRELEALRHG